MEVSACLRAKWFPQSVSKMHGIGNDAYPCVLALTLSHTASLIEDQHKRGLSILLSCLILHLIASAQLLSPLANTGAARTSSRVKLPLEYKKL